MAIVIKGKTNCSICDKAITENDNFYSFPAFVINISDPLYFFSDNNFHSECLKKNKMSATAIKYAELFISSIKPANRKSIVTGKAINDYDNHIFIEYLTSQKNNLLHQFNFIHIDKRDLPKWKERESLIKELITLKNSGTWKEISRGNYLSNLITQLSG